MPSQAFSLPHGLCQGLLRPGGHENGRLPHLGQHSGTEDIYIFADLKVEKKMLSFSLIMLEVEVEVPYVFSFFEDFI